MSDSKRVQLSTSGFEASKLVDARQRSGRLAPVFPALLTGSKKEEEYVARMIRRDRELERKW